MQRGDPRADVVPGTRGKSTCDRRILEAIEDVCDAEWAEWYRMTPEER